MNILVAACVTQVRNLPGPWRHRHSSPRSLGKEARRPAVRLAVTLALLLGARALAVSQAVALQAVDGRVVDSISALPVPQAVVRFLREDGVELSTAQSAENGRFLLTTLRPGHYQIRIESKAHRPYLSPVFSLDTQQTLTPTFALAPLAMELQPTEVVGHAAPNERRPIEGRRIKEFYTRLNRPDRSGTMVTLEQIERWNPRHAADLLQRMRGVTVRHGPTGGYIVYMTRSVTTSPRAGAALCPPLYFVDGALLGDASTVDIESVLPISIIEGVEAYPGSSSIPIEFNRNGSQCGVIAFWTR